MAPTTAEELLRMGDIGRCELIRGEIRTMMSPGCRHGRVAARVAFRITRHVERHRLGGEPRALAEADTLPGGDVLPGLAVRVAAIFAA